MRLRLGSGHHQRVLSAASAFATACGRRAARRPRATALLVLSALAVLGYYLLYHAIWGRLGRWYWNYAVAVLPSALYRFIPKGDWGPIGGPPRFVPEIYGAPWMGEFALPHLTPPMYRPVQNTSAEPHLPHRGVALSSPALVKLTIFSTVKQKAYEKRALIRRLSPVFNVPERLRHLIEVKFVLGHAYHVGEEGYDDWAVNEEMEALLAQEQATHGDLLRLDLEFGENLREGKILEWIRAVGMGRDGGRPAWWLFKIDDDSVLNLPNFLDELLSLDASKPIYTGTSLARWPAYHHHFTGMVTGFSWPLVRTLAEGIDKMSHDDIKAAWDDDFGLPPAPHCRPPTHDPNGTSLPSYCDVRRPPPNGYTYSPPATDPRTGLIRHDLLRRLGDPDVWFVSGDLAWHGWWLKFPEYYERMWAKTVEGRMWSPPSWLEQYADPTVREEAGGRAGAGE
ncbi:uncharacterized protein LOC62_03G004659 [Vanrija pseudolonga]|uniref:Hexosyltransferase n=1 Tax=Vanrija pseudolonga TaxID=143232 RepID=A0AAF0Y6Q5_9TREE|nr:hypothetical protein LOC62_03G004659 [Vanrija pseudolonga]